MVLSVHGVSSPAEAAKMGRYMNMYRVTTDVHDNWNALKTAFAASTTYASVGLEGAAGLQGKSWVDHDMLALGYQKPANGSPYPSANGLTPSEQRILMTLWGMTRSPLIYGGRMDNITDETVALLSNAEVLLVNQNATAPPRPVLHLAEQQQHRQRRDQGDPQGDPQGGHPLQRHRRYQGLGYTMVPCNAADIKQQWNTTGLSLTTQHRSDDGTHGGASAGAGAGAGADAGAVNLHKTYSKNGTLQEVCMRLMVMHSDCTNMNYTSMDLMDCSVSHCNGTSIKWTLPTTSTGTGVGTGMNTGTGVGISTSTSASTNVGGGEGGSSTTTDGARGPITNALTSHCLSVDTDGKLSTEPCTGDAGQVWNVKPAQASAQASPAGGAASSDGGSMITIQDASSGLCLAENVPTPVDSAYVWVAEAGGRYFVGLFNADDWTKTMNVSFALLGLQAQAQARQEPSAGGSVQQCTGRDVWKDADLGTIRTSLSATIPQHDVAFVELSDCR